MEITKTIKLYINGQFPRTESGRTYIFKNHKGEKLARVCQSSAKDFRNAVESSKLAHKGWSQKTAFNRSQILYRMAEMTQAKSSEFSTLFQKSLSISKTKANTMVQEAIDTFIYYAGFADKYQQLTSSINPVSGPFQNFSTSESIGVVSSIAAEKFNFAHLIDNIASIISTGNTTVVLLGNECPVVLAPLAEVLATSDLPAGVVNLLSGNLEELLDTIASHREVRAISFQNKNKILLNKTKELASNNLKRVIPPSSKYKNIENLINFTELKTIWHPIGI